VVGAAGDRKPETGRQSCTVRANFVLEDDESLAEKSICTGGGVADTPKAHDKPAVPQEPADQNGGTPQIFMLLSGRVGPRGPHFPAYGSINLQSAVQLKRQGMQTSLVPLQVPRLRACEDTGT
jgi:hypothetical protein